MLASLTFDSPLAGSSTTWRSRSLAIILMAAIAATFWVDSRYPALLKRYHAGTQIKAAGKLTFGQPYLIDRTMPLTTRIWHTSLNWLDANRVGMTFSFLFGPSRSPSWPHSDVAVPIRAISTRSSEPLPESPSRFAPTASRRSLVDSSLPA